MTGNLLYIDQAGAAAQGIYHCVIIGADGRTDTGDARLSELSNNTSVHVSPN